MYVGPTKFINIGILIRYFMGFRWLYELAFNFPALGSFNLRINFWSNFNNFNKGITGGIIKKTLGVLIFGDFPIKFMGIWAKGLYANFFTGVG